MNEIELYKIKDGKIEVKAGFKKCTVCLEGRRRIMRDNSKTLYK